MTCFCQVWKGRPWCAGSHLQEGPLPCLQPGTHRLTTHQNHLTSPSQDFPPVGERSDDQATAHAPPRETDQKAWWWVDFSFLSKMHWCQSKVSPALVCLFASFIPNLEAVNHFSIVVSSMCKELMLEMENVSNKKVVSNTVGCRRREWQ